jgi:hypothetical protein
MLNLISEENGIRLSTILPSFSKLKIGNFFLWLSMLKKL